MSDFSQDPSRQEFGFMRTRCGCGDCAAHCARMPGMLVPSDLLRLVPRGVDPFVWAYHNLNASPGAVVMDRKTDEIFRIPTLVPRALSSGACKFLHPDNGTCTIHAISPYGCAFADSHMVRSLSDKVVHAALLAIWRDFSEAGLYSWIWFDLMRQGHVAKGAEELRQTYQQGREVG